MLRWLVLGLWSVAFASNMSTANHSLAPPHEELVTVQLRSGRTVSGNVDARTDQQHLWLRLTTRNVAISTAVEWAEIEAVEYRTGRISAAQLRQLAPHLQSKLPGKFFQSVPPRSLRSVWDRGVEPVTLRVESYVANWDADLETDGVQLQIVPAAADDGLAATDGILDVRLFGYDGRVARRENPFRQIGRWSIRVRRSHFGESGATYQLPFQQVHPELDLSLDTYGEIHARLSVAGHSSLEATAALRLRTRSPLRDRLELLQGTRFLMHAGPRGFSLPTSVR